MKTEHIRILEKTHVKKEAIASSCCGGAPETNGEACCKLDEDKKAEGESGCGCNNPLKIKTSAGCC